MVQLKQQIGNTVTGEDGTSKVGMPKEVVPLVRSQKIGDTAHWRGWFNAGRNLSEIISVL